MYYFGWHSLSKDLQIQMPPPLSPFCSQSYKSVHINKTQVEGMQPNQKARWTVTST